MGRKTETDRCFAPSSRFLLLLATGFGAGYSPVVPGTAGTLVAIPIYYFLSEIPFPLYGLTLIAFFFLSCWAASQAEWHWGKKDDQRIVIDEIMGFLVTMVWVPRSILPIAAGFILFRFFDILKPFPIRHLEKVRSGFGVVVDDVLAGIYANIILHLFLLIV